MDSIFIDKPYFKKIYARIYSRIINEMNSNFSPNKKVLEIGSGSHGFIKEIDSKIITSDVIQSSNCDLKINAEKIPFGDGELSVIIGLHVLHHIHKKKSFFGDAFRTLEPGGGIILLEPSWGTLSSFLHTKFHEEPFNKKQLFSDTLDNDIPNQALGYILFKKNRKEFLKMFNGYEIASIKSLTFLEYIASGGFRPKPYIAPKLLPVLKVIDILLTPFMRTLAIHKIIILRKQRKPI
jgi:Methylase involved in ubiquinone/menaquinone biosynthesis